MVNLNMTDRLVCPNCNKAQLYISIPTVAIAPLRDNTKLKDTPKGYILEHELKIGELEDNGRVVSCSNCSFELSDTGFHLPDVDEKEAASMSNYLKYLEKCFDNTDLC